MPTLARPPGPGKKFARVSAGPWGPPPGRARAALRRDARSSPLCTRCTPPDRPPTGAGDWKVGAHSPGAGHWLGGEWGRSTGRVARARPPAAPGSYRTRGGLAGGSGSPGRGVTHSQTSILPKLPSLRPPRTPPIVANQIDRTRLSPVNPPASCRGMEDFWRFLEFLGEFVLHCDTFWRLYRWRASFQ